MSRSSVQHFSPSQSVTHLAIRHEVECAGFDVEILRNFLWLVNAHDQLIAFPFLCQNLTEILSVSTKEWGVTLNDFCFHEDTFRLLDWVVTETPNFLHPWDLCLLERPSIHQTTRWWAGAWPDIPLMRHSATRIRQTNWRRNSACFKDISYSPKRTSFIQEITELITKPMMVKTHGKVCRILLPLDAWQSGNWASLNFQILCYCYRSSLPQLILLVPWIGCR